MATSNSRKRPANRLKRSCSLQKGRQLLERNSRHGQATAKQQHSANSKPEQQPSSTPLVMPICVTYGFFRDQQHLNAARSVVRCLGRW
mmetsp:Transcript_56196/g.111688  ORF Transcript_56196/g.111688 Transcript_56196/m.111688 type:complete len:88 (-) Transcript_56196:1422-1685(-)